MTTETAKTSPALLEGQSYWQIVYSAFSRRVLNLGAVGFIGLLAVLAVLVPFLASGHPYTIVFHTPQGDVRQWPLFANLDKIDISLLIIAAAMLLYIPFYRTAGRNAATREELFARRIRSALILGGITLLIVTAVCIFRAPRVSPYDYRAYESLIKDGQASGAIFAPVHFGYAEQEPLSANRIYEFPTREHPLGTDGIGRDSLSRLLWSTRVVLGIGFVAEGIALFIGVIIGALMGYFAGKTDLIGMRLIEIFEAIPTFILILIFVATYGRNLFLIMVIFGFTGWTGIARFTRAEFLRLRNLDYVHAAIAGGLPLHRVLFRHMLPNGLTPVIVTITFGVAGMVMSESGLSFLGVGVEPPTPSWGSLLNEAGNPAETFRWWLAIAPGFMIFLTVFAYNVIGEGLRDAMDPRLNRLR